MALAQPVPAWLLGPGATACAVLFLCVVLVVIFALTAVQMRAERLPELSPCPYRSKSGSRTMMEDPTIANSELEASGGPQKSRRAKKPRRKFRLPRLVQFLIGEDEKNMVDEEVEPETDANPYHLADGMWLQPVEVSSQAYFIGDGNLPAVATSPREGSMDVFDLADSAWRVPITV